MCVAAAAFRPFGYEWFLHEWRLILDAWGASAFHASDFYPGGRKSPFWRNHPDGTVDPERLARFERHSKEIPLIIGKYVHQLFVMSLRKDEFEAVAPSAWRQQFGGVHRVAAQMTLSQVGFWAQRVNYSGDVDVTSTKLATTMRRRFTPHLSSSLPSQRSEHTRGCRRYQPASRKVRHAA